MYSKILNIIGFAVVYSGCLKWIAHRYSKCFTTLVYHDPNPEVVQRHISFIKKYFNLASADGSAYLSFPEAELDRAYISLSFDDGYVGYLELDKLLKQHSLKAHMYITTGVIGSDKCFWWENISNNNALRDLKELSNAKRELALADIHQSDTFSKLNLTVENVVLLCNNQVCGAHTVSHPILEKCTDDECKREIVDSIDQLFGIGKTSVNTFAYPNGQYRDFGHREIEILKSKGVGYGRTTEWKFLERSQIGRVSHKLPGIIVFDNASVYELATRIVGFDHLLKRLYSYVR